MTINVLQFIRPNGRQAPQTTEVSDDCADGYKLMQECGCRLTAEVLTTGEVSCTIEHPAIGDFDIEVTENGPDVPKGIERMLKEFSKEKFEAWKKEMI